MPRVSEITLQESSGTDITALQAKQGDFPDSWVPLPLTAYRRQDQKTHTGLAFFTDTEKGAFILV